MNKQQLANKIWASANKMRSKIDANEYKDYILGLIFYKFLCDNEEQYLRKDGWTDEDMPFLVEDYEDANAKDTIEYCKNNIGYFIEYKYLFSTWLKPDSMFNVADLSAALNNFDRLVSANYRSVYEKIFLTLQAGLSKLGENPASLTRALKDLIKLNDGSLYKAKGRIETVSGVVDPATGAVQIKALFPNPERELLSGSIGNIVLRNPQTDAITIPMTATVELQDKIIAYRLKNGRAEAAYLTVDRLNDGNRFIVKEGLSVGDTLIAEGVGLVREGMSITPKDETK